MKSLCFLMRGKLRGGCLALFLSAVSLLRVQANPTINSTVPTSGAVNVSLNSTVVFTFSETMDTSQTAATFIDGVTFSLLPTTPVWSAGNTVLTCTPSSPWGASRTIYWSVSGQNPIGDALGGTTTGFFNTTSGSSSGGSGTNATTTFTVGKTYLYDQNSTAAATPDPTSPYAASAAAVMASNRVATAVTVTLPNSSVSNLTQEVLRHERFDLFASYTSLATMNGTWGDATYTFNIYSNGVNTLTGTANLSSGIVQPSAPHLANYTAAQSVDASQSFTLSWDAFSGGTASDFIYVNIGDIFVTPEPGKPGALAGMVTSVQIPAGTLGANSNYQSFVTFYHVLATSNATYTSIAYRGASTKFTLTTVSGGGSGPLVLTNAAKAAGSFSFDVISTNGQTFTLECTSNLTSVTWQTWLTTNSPTGHLRLTDSRANTNRNFFYRARNGP
jgi:hypothetical protein